VDLVVENGRSLRRGSGAPLLALARETGRPAAFSRSAELTRGRRWGIFGLLFLLGLVLLAALFLWFVPVASRSDITASELTSSAMVFVALLAVFQMLTGIVEAVSYALLRQDKDGVSHAELARIFD
jgi:hypothetical protein